jgi:uncharacterized membrane protein
VNHVVQFNEIAPALFGLASAASWGAGDFCGGMATRRSPVFPVVVGAHLVGAVGFTLLAALTGEALPPARNLAWCAVAGLSGAVGLVALYRALAVGRMGVAAPVSGVLSAAVPVAAGAAFAWSLTCDLPGLVFLGAAAFAAASVLVLAATPATS